MSGQLRNSIPKHYHRPAFLGRVSAVGDDSFEYYSGAIWMKDILLNTVETYRTLQPFQTIEQLNANTAEIRTQFGKELTRSTYRVLDVLARYSCKYYGVSYRSKSKIAAELGISRRTVITACNKLESLGVIVQHELKRHNGDKRQSSNAIVFVAIITTEKEVKKEDCTPEFHTKETPLNSNNINQSFHDTFQFEPSLYNRFKSLLSNSIGDTTPASRLYGVYRAQSIKLQRSISFDCV